MNPPYQTGSKLSHFPLARTMCLALSLGLSLGLLSGIARAQLTAAAIQGTVKDQSGAAIAGAAVTLQAVATHTVRTTSTNGAGAYSFVDVSPGDYTLSITKAGFGTAHQKAVTLSVNQTAQFNFTLKVGSTQQTVTVSSAAQQLQTSTSNLGTVFNRKAVADLPLNGRNFTQLLTLTPGSSGVDTAQTASAPNAIVVGETSFPAVNGQWNRSNLFLLDGINDMQVSFSLYSVPPIVDAIQEFKMESHSDQSKFGGAMGGVVNIVTKSGTNEFHGDAWDFLRNDALDAKNAITGKKTPLKQNVYGATIGGPVIVPFYNGRNRTFFFGAYEGTIINSAASRLYNVPTAEELAGDFSAIPQQLYDPYSTSGLSRTAFPDNNISSRLDPSAVKLAEDVFPKPTPLINGFNGLDTTPSQTRQYNYSLRLDEHINPSNILSARFSQVYDNTAGSGGYAGLASHAKSGGQNWSVSYVHVFGASATLQLQAGHNWQDYSSQSNFTNAPPTLIDDSGFSRSFVCGFVYGSNCKIPNIQIPGYLSGGEVSSSQTGTDLYEYKGDFTKLLGNHVIEVGAALATDSAAVINSDGTVAYSAFQTSDLQSTANTGDALAAFLIGVPTSAWYRNLVKNPDGANISSYYFQDQWKATRKLTVNWGLRYDLVITPTLGPSPTASQYTGAYDLSKGVYEITKDTGKLGSCETLHAPPCIPGGTLPDHVVVLKDNRLLQNQYDNLQPRIGFAFEATPRTVFHLSYGRVYDTWSAVLQSAQNEGALWPNVSIQQVSNLNSTTVTAPASDPIGLGTTGEILPAATPFGQVAYFVDPHVRNPYSDQWLAGIQQQVGRSNVLTLNYVGSTTKRLRCCGFYNTALTPGPGTPQSRALYTYITPTHYDRSVGLANYNALQAQFKRQAATGLLYTLNYTWSKAMDNGCDGAFGVEGCSVRDPYNPGLDYSVAGFDLPNIFTGTVLYQLPFGRNQRFRTGNPVADVIIGGWQLNAIASLNSGTPYSIRYSGDRANTGNNVEGVDLVGDPNVSDPTRARWFNTAAFQAPALYSYGNVRRDTMRSQANRDVDLSLFRTFTVERYSAQLRLEAFNALNDVVYAAPNATQNSKTFGVIGGTANTARILQLALKLSF